METIKRTEYSILIYFLSHCMFVGIAIHNILKITRQDSFISIIIGFLIGLIPLYVFYKLLNCEEENNIIDKINKHFILGKFINLLIIFLIIFHAGCCLWNLCNFVNSQFLFHTPLLVIGICFMIAVIYVTSKGITIIGRTGIILFIFSVLLFILTISSLVGYYEIRHIMPLFESSLSNIFNSSLTSICYNILPIYVLLIVPKNNITDNKKLGKSLFYTYLYTFLATFLIMYSIIAIFGPPLALLYQYPEFHLLKIINVGNFFQRVESILSMQWLFTFTMSLILYVYYAKEGIKNLFNFKCDNIIILVISLIVIILSQTLFINDTVAYDFFQNIYRYLLLLLFIIPLILLFKISLKK